MRNVDSESLSNLLSENEEALQQLLVHRSSVGSDDFIAKLQDSVKELPLPIQQLLQVRYRWMAAR